MRKEGQLVAESWTAAVVTAWIAAAIAATVIAAWIAARWCTAIYRYFFANNARNTNGYCVRHLCANPTWAANGFGFAYISAYGVRNLASLCLAFPTVNGAARNLFGAGFANPVANGIADFFRAWLANPFSYAAIYGFRAWLAYPTSTCAWNGFANFFASVSCAADFFGFTSWNPNTSAACAVR